MKYWHVIWDWNGTLLDDAWLFIEVLKGMLADRNLPPVSAEHYAQIFGFPVKDYFQKAGFDFKREPFTKINDEFFGEYERRKLECRLREGAVEILSEIIGRGITQSILSASPQIYLDEVVKFFDLEGFFIARHGLKDNVAFGKVDVGLQWLSELGLPPNQILMVGDTIHDHEVAGTLGVDCILIPGGHQDRGRLEATGAPVIDSLAELDF
jgi:phosphoglycolate phosphatase